MGIVEKNIMFYDAFRKSTAVPYRNSFLTKVLKAENSSRIPWDWLARAYGFGSESNSNGSRHITQLGDHLKHPEMMIEILTE